MPSIEELQQQLTDKIARLDEERKIHAAQFAKEREEALQDAAMERAKQVEEYNKIVAAREKQAAEEASAAQEKLRIEKAERLANERAQNELQETLRLQREKLEWLTNEITKAEFSEEQHRKAMADMRIVPVTPVLSTDINVEHPEAPLNTLAPGEAVIGTDGNTPNNPLMSEHLRSILRQATRV
jgi:hypothetical protein